MSSKLLLTTIAFSALLGVSLAAYKAFDCRRQGITCERGPCKNGLCICPSKDFGGDNCGVVVANITSTTACSLNCGANGQCVTDGKNDKCVCNAEYYGKNCEHKRVEVTDCTADSMTVNINPYGDFFGKIYVEMLSGIEGCEFRPVDPAADIEGYQLRLSLSTDTSVNKCASKLQKKDGSSTYHIIEQYNADYLTFTDQRHKVSCSEQGSVGIVGALVNSGSLQEVDLGGLSGQTISQTSLDVPISMKVTNRDAARTPVSQVIRVGDKLYLEVSMPTTTSKDYVNFFVEGCSSYNRDFRVNSTVPLVQKELVRDRCPAAKAMDVLDGDISKDGGSVLIPFRGFKFELYDSVYMSCSVKLCKADNKAECEPIACDRSGNFTGFGRRKRQTSASEDKVNVIRRVFVVTLADDAVDAPSSGGLRVEKQPCVESIAFVATAAVFGVVLTLALIAALVLCLRHTRQRAEQKKMAGKANGLYQ